MEQNIIYGIHTVEHAINKDPHKILEIVTTINCKNKRILSLLAIAKQYNLIIKTMDKHKLKAYCANDDHQGVAAKMQFTTCLLAEDDLLALVENKQYSLLLVLDGIQDPHNLGAILRTADAVGVHAVVVPQDNSVKLTSAVRKVACGAAENVPFVQVKNLARFLKLLQYLGVWTVGTELQQAQTIYDIDLTGPIAIILGAEGKGLRQLTTKYCDYLVSIPMVGKVESLNVSVAAGICLYEVVRQRLSS